MVAIAQTPLPIVVLAAGAGSARYSTLLAVSSMNASSSEARTVASSCSLMRLLEREVADLGGGQAADLDDVFVVGARRPRPWR